MKKKPNQSLQCNAMAWRFLFATAVHRVADQVRSATMTHALIKKFLLLFAASLSFAGDRQQASAIPQLFQYGSPGAKRTASLGVQIVDPPVDGFYAKLLDLEGIPIRASDSVSDQALVTAKERIAKLIAGLGDYRVAVITRLRHASVELHVIGRAEAVTDLPENTSRKGERVEDYGGLTLDERTRGTGGRLVSCGEENLLGLPSDRYLGKDICIHEFSHALFAFGLPVSVQVRFVRQFEASLKSGRWTGEYAGTNPDEFFAELSMMYFGRAREGLKIYDVEAYALFDGFYRGEFSPKDFAAADP